MSLKPNPDIPWRTLSPKSIPDPHKPVLMRFVTPVQVSEKTNAASSEHNKSILRPFHNYGFALGILQYQTDGFGNPYPTTFCRLTCSTEGVLISDAIQLSSVVAWCYLNHVEVPKESL